MADNGGPAFPRFPVIQAGKPMGHDLARLVRGHGVC